MDRQEEIVRLTSWKGQEQAHTSWRWADKKKWSDQLLKRIENKHIPPEDGQTRRNGQINFMEGSRTSTYPLKMGRQVEMIRSTSWKGQEQVQTSWRWADKKKMVRSTTWKDQEQAHTSWRWANKEKWSGQLCGRVKNKQIPPEEGQTRRNGQANFIKGSRTSTYLLKMSR